MFLMAETPDYEPRREDSIGALARARGVAPEAVALDHMMTRGGRGMLYLPFLNYADGGLDPAYDMLRHLTKGKLLNKVKTGHQVVP